MLGEVREALGDQLDATRKTSQSPVSEEVRNQVGTLLKAAATDGRLTKYLAEATAADADGASTLNVSVARAVGTLLNEAAADGRLQKALADVNATQAAEDVLHEKAFTGMLGEVREALGDQLDATRKTSQSPVSEEVRNQVGTLLKAAATDGRLTKYLAKATAADADGASTVNVSVARGVGTLLNAAAADGRLTKALAEASAPKESPPPLPVKPSSEEQADVARAGKVHLHYQ